mmetsp:Transcript_78210/g.201345  ORF Transcript_78210/g.201345 Transcript_78210/m.201345 type:complete len:204 (-) Transcript_78210:433-1044(-)
MADHEAEGLAGVVKPPVGLLLSDPCRDQRLQHGHKGDTEGCGNDATDLALSVVGQRLRWGDNHPGMQLPILVLERGDRDAAQVVRGGEITKDDGHQGHDNRPRDWVPLHLGDILHETQEQRSDNEEEDGRRQAGLVDHLQGLHDILIEVLVLGAWWVQVKGHVELVQADDQCDGKREALEDRGGHQEKVALQVEHVDHEDHAG